jgi:Uma2 family endonuclease
MINTVLNEIEGETNSHQEIIPSLNHSYICFQLMKQLISNEAIVALPELTLNIGNGLTPNISIFLQDQIKPNFFEDVFKFPDKPIIAIEVISSSQTIQEMLQKAKQLVREGVKATWTVEPYSRTVFVTTIDRETLFHEEVIACEGVQVDFSRIFV